MGDASKSPNRRRRGNIETLRSGALRARVYSGRDPVTKRPHYLTETIPAGTPNAEKLAEQALTRLLSQLDEQRAPRTNASVSQLVDEYLAVVEIERSTMRGWRSKVKNHIRPLLGKTPLSKVDTHVVESFGEVKRLLAHLIIVIPDRAATWAWSHWRRRHQHRAKQAHYQRRQALHHEVRLEY